MDWARIRLAGEYESVCIFIAPLGPAFVWIDCNPIFCTSFWNDIAGITWRATGKRAWKNYYLTTLNCREKVTLSISTQLDVISINNLNLTIYCPLIPESYHSVVQMHFPYRSNQLARNAERSSFAAPFLLEFWLHASTLVPQSFAPHRTKNPSMELTDSIVKSKLNLSLFSNRNQNVFPIGIKLIKTPSFANILLYRTSAIMPFIKNSHKIFRLHSMSQSILAKYFENMVKTKRCADTIFPLAVIKSTSYFASLVYASAIRLSHEFEATRFLNLITQLLLMTVFGIIFIFRLKWKQIYTFLTCGTESLRFSFQKCRCKLLKNYSVQIRQSNWIRMTEDMTENCVSVAVLRRADMNVNKQRQQIDTGRLYVCV